MSFIPFTTETHRAADDVTLNRTYSHLRRTNPKDCSDE